MTESFIHVVTGVVANRGLVLMQQRGQHQLRPRMWETPGGKVEVGEVPREALIRELHEEIGVVVTPVEVSQIRLNIECAARVTLFECAAVVGTPRGNENQRIAWVDPEYAVKHLPCVPSFYMFYRDILQIAKWSTALAGTRGLEAIACLR